MKNKNILISMMAICMVGVATTILYGVCQNKNNIVNGYLEHDENCWWNHYGYRAPTSSDPGCQEYWVCCEHHTPTFTKPEIGKNLDGDVLEVSDDTIAYLKAHSDDPRYIAPNKLFLPSTIAFTDSYSPEYNFETNFVYDDDLLGFISTEIHESSKEKYSYRFDTTFSSFTEIYEEYTLSAGEEYRSTYSKRDYKKLDNNGSYEVREYEYDEEKENFVFLRVRGKTFNENGRILRDYYLKPLNGDETTLYTYYNDVNVYDEDGFVLSESEYEYDSKTGEDYLSYSSVYTYDGNNHSHCIEEDYYNNDGEMVKDGWADIDITFEDGLIKFDEQRYLDDDSLGNHNIIHYNENWQRVYTNYGGMHEETSLSFNQYNQKIAFSYDDVDRMTNLSATYENNGGPLKTVSMEEGSAYYTATSNTTFSYSDLNQMTGGIEEIESVESLETINITREVEIEYSELQNDRMLSFMSYIDDTISHLSHYILRSDESI